MSEDFTYQDYVSDKKFIDEYNSYQERYASTIRESDKVLIQMVNDLVEKAGERRLKVLDVGCSTGNLLLHMKRMVPDADYVGGDLAASSIAICKKNPQLSGIEFEEMDVLNLPEDVADVIIVNAVFYMFDEDQYAKALASIAKALREGGKLVIYDFAHPFEHQNLVIYETSVLHQEGLRLCFRPMRLIQQAMDVAGFASTEFYPFELPIDLPMPGYDKDVVTYTVNRDDDSRMMFRGALFQPWCHMIVSKG